MEVSPKTLREVEFREKMRGYHPEDVDHFLEQVAAGLEVLQDRLRQAVERAQRAEAAASEAGNTDDMLRKTLVLAQRTADMAVQEARDQAARILAGAEQQAQAVLAEAEEKGRLTLEETLAESRVELGRLEVARAQAQHEVEGLKRWIDEHRAHLQSSLSEAMAAVERAGLLWSPPSPQQPSVPPGPETAQAPPVPSAAAPSTGGDPEGGPPTVAWAPAEAPGDRRDDRAAPEAAGGLREILALDDESLRGPDDQALDDFFDDRDDLVMDRRIGGRLRRRR